MREYIYTILKQSGSLSVQDIVLHIVAAAVISVAIYVSYWFTHAGTTYSKKFNVSLIALTVLTATVMTVIGNNVALSLGMVGALSIVRFRTAIKDSRDTAYIFWTIIVGICCGVGDYLVASIGTGIVFFVLLILGRVRNDNRILLIIRGDIGQEHQIEGLVFEYFKAKALMRVKNTTPNSIEMIFELTKKTYDMRYQREKDITAMLYDLGNIEYVNIVMQSDEING